MQFYPIGTPGTAWGANEKSLWLARQTRQRSYADLVLNVVDQLRERLDIVQYGQLDYLPDTYSLMALRSRDWQEDRPVALVTGGVHGYESSGVFGALQFAAEHAQDYAGRMDVAIVPCVSPWGFERINRWNPAALDPNRSFRANSPAGESAALMQWVAPFAHRVRVHIDLHETTDTDESEFRPALAARDGLGFTPGSIPDGFYLVDDVDSSQPDFQQAIIQAVKGVTHIAPADEKGEIIGSTVVAPGVIQYALRPLGLCAGITDARYRTTTEVYPDSPQASAPQCNAAQVAAIRAALDYALSH